MQISENIQAIKLLGSFIEFIKVEHDKMTTDKFSFYMMTYLIKFILECAPTKGDAWELVNAAQREAKKWDDINERVFFDNRKEEADE